jgi:hypothetical protein
LLERHVIASLSVARRIISSINSTEGEAEYVKIEILSTLKESGIGATHWERQDLLSAAVALDRRKVSSWMLSNT